VIRVAYLTPQHFDENSYLGGGERYPINLARGVVAASGGEICVQIVAYGPAEQRAVLAPGVELHVLAAERFSREEDALSWELVQAVAEADIVHVHQVLTLAGEAGVLCARLLGKPVCATDHGGATSAAATTLGILDITDRVVCYSEFGASRLRTAAPVLVVKGGVDGGWFSPPPAGTPRDRVVFVGRLMPHKGIDQLIAALPDGLRLTVCGRPYRRDYVELLHGLAEGRPVEFVTDADDEVLRELYRHAYAVVLPSVYRDCYGQTYEAPELMGLSLLEGMACGAPAVCSRVAAMPEFVDDGRTGFVYDSLSQLRELLGRLAADPELVAALGENARRSVERQYDISVVGQTMAGLYRELMTVQRCS
jgi:glycosyltransferase involved in cell wall biosynthesis